MALARSRGPKVQATLAQGTQVAQAHVPVATHPLNLALRFLLELAALWGLGAYGWARSGGARWVYAILFPLVAATLWGGFAVPGDPSRGGKPAIVVPGLVRLALELAVFGAGTWALYALGRQRSASLLGCAVVFHYALSLDRIRWLLAR